jgi:carbonic anhydrase/acetyltransferase-like protein (isoleucine patch superfamily)
MKYELTDETKQYYGVTLRRIRYLADGSLGGWIEGASNLWQSGSAKVYGNAKVYGSAVVYGSATVSGDARVYGNAKVYGSAVVSGDATVFGDARVYGSATVSGSAKVSGDAKVYGNATVSGDATVSGSAVVSGNAGVRSVRRSDGYPFAAFMCADGKVRVTAGCRYFTLAEARKHWKATRAGTPLGDETMMILALLEHQTAQWE